LVVLLWDVCITQYNTTGDLQLLILRPLGIDLYTKTDYGLRTKLKLFGLLLNASKSVSEQYFTLHFCGE